MDIALHAFSSAVVTYKVTQSKFLAIIAGLAGAFPDLVGIAEKWFKERWDVWNWYRAIHSIIAAGVCTIILLSVILFSSILNIDFMRVIFVCSFWYLFHLGADYLWHEPKTGHWYSWGVILDILLWMLAVVLLFDAVILNK